jgi:hypothetical protein
MFNEIEQLIDELIETIGKIRQNRETNVSAVKEQKILVENEIRTSCVSTSFSISFTAKYVCRSYTYFSC